MVWFLLVETETVPMGWAPYEPMMPAAQGLDTRSWLGGGLPLFLPSLGCEPSCCAALACFGCEFGGHGCVVKTDALFACAGE